MKKQELERDVKKYFNFKVIIVIVTICFYLIAGFTILQTQTNNINKKFTQTLKDKSKDLAILLAESFVISDQEVNDLLNLTYSEAKKHPAFIRFNNLFNSSAYSDEIRFAYIVRKLSSAQIKYYVDANTKDYYNAEIGTPLDGIWLIDCIVNTKEREQANKNNISYQDINRYTSLDNNYAIHEVYDKRKIESLIVKDEFGTSFSGVVPLYSNEGSFVGLVGIDVNYTEYLKKSSLIKITLIIVFLSPTILLSIIYLTIIFSRKKTSEKLTYTDSLTTLYNRRYLEKTLKNVTRDMYFKKLYLSTIMLDIDYFKNYNDNYGHVKGDEVLQKIARAIKNSTRDKHDLVYRYGGEEIFIILPNTNKEGAIIVAEKIKTSIKELQIEHCESKVSNLVTVSQGIYSQKPHGYKKDDIACYVDYPDKALYKAKQSGRNHYELFTIKDLKEV